MAKIKVRDLAKKLKKPINDVIVALKRQGIYVESQSSMLSGSAAAKVEQYFNQQPNKQENNTRQPAKQPAKKKPVRHTGGLDSNGDYSSFIGSEEEEMLQNMEKKKSAQEAAKKEAASAPQAADSKPAAEKPKTQEKPAQEKPAPEKKAEHPQSRAETAEAAPAEKKAEKTEKTAPAAQEEKKQPVREQEAKSASVPSKEEKAGGAREEHTGDGPRHDRQGRNGGRDGQRRDGGRDGQNRGGRDGQRRDGQGRNGGRDGQRRDGSRDGQNRGGRGGQGRDGQRRDGSRDGQNRGGRGNGGRFNLNKAIDKEVAAPSKDSGRDSRRSFNKDGKARDNRRYEKDYDDRNQERKVRNNKNNHQQHKKPAPQKPAVKEEKITSITLPDELTISELAQKMKVPANQLIKKLFLAGKMYTLNSEITYDEAEEIAIDYDILCEHEVMVDAIEEMLKEEEENEADMVPRPPVVCVMGHVDHGKTSILDAIRKTNVTAGEAGGITQRIGAYVVNIKGKKITFIDTPGHEAFTAMRLRGAQSTDIAILVVAADDGVMPQTIEAINHAKAADIDIIVAINKIDKPGANIDRVKQELTEYGLVAEDWGGSTIMVPVSAKTGEGLSDLLDMVLLDAEMLELKANPNRNGRGVILEAQLDRGRGPVATALVQKGTLHIGDNITAGTCFGKIRAMVDDKGRKIKKAGPSVPVEILGFNDVPNAGDTFIATETEKEARAMAETFIAKQREKLLAETKSRLSLDSLFDQIKEGELKELNIIVKADVQGSVEAVKQSLGKLSNAEVVIKVIHGGVGAINESDVTLASASNAIIIGFNVRPDTQAKNMAEQEHVDIRLYRVIYNAIEDIEAAMKGMLEPTYQENIIGHVDVRQTYKVSGIGTIIGGYITDGKVVRDCKVRLLRDNVVIYEGALASLRRFKDDVKEVNRGYECGMSLEKFNDIKVGDQVEAYVMEEVPR